ISASTKSQEPISKSNPKKLTKLPANPTEPKFPILSLVVSGGHTQLILMTDHFKYQVVGETQDDAAGEAFDKVARLLGLGYPGGPIISQKAHEHEIKSNFKKYILPRPMLHSKNFDFSFSGLKTAVLYTVKNYRKANNLNENDKLPEDFVRELAYEFQEAATDVLTHKTIQAAIKHNPKNIFLAGGVSANSNLREKLGQAIEKNIPQINYRLQPITYSTDNAAMIAVAASYRWEEMNSSQKEELLNTWKTLQTSAQLNL
ncbi:MAG: hypothetical protein RBS77_03970, partial [Candidatus Moranbacteria bacterium]|nr:hypothetical protein [Candidatus Moranbacteria bacterium]